MFWGFGIEEQHIGALGVAVGAVYIFCAGDRDHLNHRQAEAAAYFCHACGRFVAVELDHIQLHIGADFQEVGIIGVHHQSHFLRVLRCHFYEAGRLWWRDEAGGWREEVEAEEGGFFESRTAHIFGP